MDKAISRRQFLMGGNDHFRTFVESTFFTFAQGYLNGFLTQKGVEPGKTNGKIEPANYRSIIKQSITRIGLAPAIEEFGRLLLNLVPPEQKDDWLKRGIPTSAFFALMHNMKEDGSFDTDRIPISHFVSALYYWYLLKHKGFDHSLLAHANNNTITMVHQMLKNI